MEAAVAARKAELDAQLARRRAARLCRCLLLRRIRIARARNRASDARVDAYMDAPTMVEQGNDTTFVNWRGFFAAPGLPADKLAMYQDAIAKMYDTPEWEAVRARNGWVNIHNPGDDFQAFLEGQEKVIGDLMKKLGFL